MILLRRAIAAIAAVALVAVAPTAAYADSTRDGQWWLKALDIAEVHRITKGAGVTVAVIDTGVYAKHPDLKGVVVGGIDTIDNDTRIIDDSGHGTGMTSILAGRGHGGGRGMLGIAPEAKVLAVRPNDDALFVNKGIDWAVAHGAKVINMSFGLPSSEGLQAAVRRAAAKDVVLVASVGNTGDKDNAEEFPGGYPEVIGVGAVDRKGKVAKFSQHGEQVDIVAPGVDIVQADVGDGYRTGFGSSNASAIVAGAAALIRAKYPELTAQQVTDRLIATSEDRGAKGRDDFYGHGALNLAEALTAPQPAASSAAPATAPAGPAVATGNDDSSGGGIPPLVFVAGGLLLLIVAVLAVVLAVRSSRRTA
ncbi:S8 family serine peptidase [Actinoplanes sp. NPDC051633]|uniref:S8 family serine peptidase n=1 Tax=Actinoplanes sp. NPDC051633 TaxID=3155670 RepID=UPI00341DF5D6